MGNNSYRNLLIWQKSMDLVEEIYAIVKLLPREETFSLSDQMRRAAVSIPSNIAEGQSRKSAKEFLYFLNIAVGSKSELETQLLICSRLHFLSEEQIQKSMSLCDEISKMIYALTDKMSRQTETVD